MPSYVLYSELAALTTDLAVPFEFISRNYVKVYARASEDADQVEFSGDLYSEGTHYNWLNDGQIELVEPADGATDYLVIRETPEGAVVEQQAVRYSSTKLNLAVLQALHRSEELADRATRLVSSVGLVKGRTLRVPYGETLAELPPASERLGGGLVLGPDDVTGAIGLLDGTAFKGDPGSGGNIVATGSQLDALTPITAGDQYEVSTTVAAGTYVAVEEGTETDEQAELLAEDTLATVARPNASAGITFFKKLDRVTPEEVEVYGSLSDPDTAADAIQKAGRIAAITGAVLRLDDRVYQTKYPVFLESNTIIEGFRGKAVIQNLFDTDVDAGHSSTGACLFMGESHPIYNALADGGGTGTAGGNATQYYAWKQGTQVRAGQRSIVLATPAQAAQFTKGMVVGTRSAEYSVSPSTTPVARNQLPHYQSLNVVAEDGNGSTGEVKLEWPWLEDVTTPYIVDWNSPSEGPTNQGILAVHDLYAVKNVRIEGIGLLVTDDAAFPIQRSAFVGCDLHFTTVEGPTAIGGNKQCHSRIEVDRIVSGAKMIELADGSCGTRYILNHVAHEYTTAISGTKPPIKIGESAQHCRIDIHAGSFRGNSSATSQPDLILVGECNQIEVNMDRTVEITGYWAQLVQYSGLATETSNDTTATHPLSSKFTLNSAADTSGAVCVTTFDCSCTANYSDGNPVLRHCVINAEFRHTPSTRHGEIQGLGMEFRGLWTGVGGLRYTPDAAPSSPLETIIDIEGKGPWLESYARDKTTFCRLNGKRHRSKPYTVTTSSTTYAPDAQNGGDQHITFTGASFELSTALNVAEGQRLAITLINGTAGSITPTANATNYPSVALPALAAGRACSFVVERNSPTGIARFRLVEPVSAALQ